jgi:hypothetical protein
MNGIAAKPNDLSGQRFFSLLGTLREHVTEMFQKEINLLKTELGEKCSSMGKDGILIVAGGLVAYTGVIFLLIGLCALIIYALEKAGLSLVMGIWIAFLAFGLVIAGVGYGVLQAGLGKLKKTSLAPKETLFTVKEFKDPEKLHVGPSAEEKSDSSKTHVARVSAEKKIEQVQADLAEVRSRLTPRYMWAATCTAAKRRPQLSASIGAAVMALGYLMIRRRRHHIA